jgi:hypothetical protein
MNVTKLKGGESSGSRLMRGCEAAARSSQRHGVGGAQEGTWLGREGSGNAGFRRKVMTPEWARLGQTAS